jgi:TIR domain-containing protein
MSPPAKIDTVEFPGGYEITDIMAAVKLGAMKHLENPPFGETDRAILERFLTELAARHPESVPFTDPYQVRGQELFEQRLRLVYSHLGLTWFSLAYWVYGLIAVRSGLSIAEFNDLRMFVVPVKGALRELGIVVTEQEYLDELERFLPLNISPHALEASTFAFLSFVRFLHHGALRRRQMVTPAMSLPPVCLAFAEADAPQVQNISSFLSSHGVSLLQRENAAQGSRLLVLLSREAIKTENFWSELAKWQKLPVVPMILCLMPKAELYREAPASAPAALWAWLNHNVAVELASNTDRYLTLLRALDSPDPRQWWWHEEDAIELGLAVDILKQGIPRPRRAALTTSTTGMGYPYVVDGTILATCVLASDRINEEQPSGPDTRYGEICNELQLSRQRPGGEPYGLPWFALVYRTWLSFTAQTIGSHAFTFEEIWQTCNELAAALFALGIGTQPTDALTFLEAFNRLPWETPPTSVEAIDDRTVAFMILVHNLSHAALARGQRMRLQHPANPCFISYARPDENFARAFVAHLEAKGTDVWWDLNALTLGTNLDDSLKAAVETAKVLFVIRSPASDQSQYVRFEVETAIQNGLRVVPIAADDTGAFDQALAQLQRTPDEQLAWLRSQPQYANLRNYLTQLRHEVQ